MWNIYVIIYKNATGNAQGVKDWESTSTFMAENNSIAADHGDQNIATVYHKPAPFLSIRVTLPIFKMSNM